MAPRWDKLIAEFEQLSTGEGQIRFIISRTGLSDDCVRRVLVQLSTQLIQGEEGDPGLLTQSWSIEQYVIAMNSLMQMDFRRTEARLKEVHEWIKRGKDSGYSDEELEARRKEEAFVETVASLSGEEGDVVGKIWSAYLALMNRQLEVVGEALCLKASGESPSGSILELD